MMNGFISGALVLLDYSEWPVLGRPRPL